MRAMWQKDESSIEEAGLFHYTVFPVRHCLTEPWEAPPALFQHGQVVHRVRGLGSTLRGVPMCHLWNIHGFCILCLHLHAHEVLENILQRISAILQVSPFRSAPTKAVHITALLWKSTAMPQCSCECFSRRGTSVIEVTSRDAHPRYLLISEESKFSDSRFANLI